MGFKLANVPTGTVDGVLYFTSTINEGVITGLTAHNTGVEDEEIVVRVGDIEIVREMVSATKPFELSTKPLIPSDSIVYITTGANTVATVNIYEQPIDASVAMTTIQAMVRDVGTSNQAVIDTIQGLVEAAEANAIRAENALPVGVLNDDIIGPDNAWSSEMVNNKLIDADVTVATMVKSFTVNEVVEIPLSKEVLVPNVSVTKEIPQVGLTNNDWTVNGNKYEQESDRLSIGATNVSISPYYVGYNPALSSYVEISALADLDFSQKYECISRDGLLYMGRDSNTTFTSYQLSTANDITTRHSPVSYGVSSTKVVQMMPDGDKVMMYTQSNALLEVYDTSTPYSLSGLTLSSSGTIYQYMNSWIRLLAGGRIIAGGNGSILYYYNLATPYDISTKGDLLNIYTNTTAYGPTTYGGIYWFDMSPDGTEFWFSKNRTQTGKATDFTSFTLGVPYNLQTLTKVTTIESKSESVCGYYKGIFTGDGKYIYLYSIYNPKLTPRKYDLRQQRIIAGEYISTVTNLSGQIDTTYWTDIRTLTVSETLNSQKINYAISTDDKTTFQIAKTLQGFRNIVKFDTVWKYNSDSTYENETWTEATTNNMYQALNEAMTIAANKMPKTQINALLNTEYFVLGTTLDLATILFTTNDRVTPVFNGVSINYDANVLNRAAIAGTDYTWVWQAPEQTKIRFTALVNSNLKIRIS